MVGGGKEARGFSRSLSGFAGRAGRMQSGIGSLSMTSFRFAKKFLFATKPKSNAVKLSAED
jgi:hypothetical protein